MKNPSKILMYPNKGKLWISLRGKKQKKKYFVLLSSSLDGFSFWVGIHCVEGNYVLQLGCVFVRVNDVTKWDFFLSLFFFFFCPSWEFTIVLRAMSLTLKTLQSQGLFFFFFLSWGTRFWLLGHLLFPGRGSNAYYSPLICPAIIKSLEAVTDCPESDITSEDA